MNDTNFTDFDNRGGAKVNESGAGQIYDYMGASFLYLKHCSFP